MWAPPTLPKCTERKRAAPSNRIAGVSGTVPVALLLKAYDAAAAAVASERTAVAAAVAAERTAAAAERTAVAAAVAAERTAAAAERTAVAAVLEVKDELMTLQSLVAKLEKQNGELLRVNSVKNVRGAFIPGRDK